MLENNNKVIKHKVGLLNLAEELGNVSKSCKVMGLSRDTFYRYKAAVEDGGIDALIDKSRRKANYKNRVDEETEKAALDYAVEFPAHGQHRVSNELGKRGVFISGSGVRCVWIRHGLGNFKERLRLLEEKVKQEGKTQSPQTNGICERSHKTILQEFYQVTFRKKIYTDIDSLQKNLDEWL